MKSKISETEYIICKVQGSIYEYQAKKGYDIAVFSELYLKSDFCKRAFDTIYSRFQWADAEECLDFIIPEIGDKCKKLKSNEEFSPDVAFWIGFTYRHLYIRTEIPSEELVQIIPFDSMLRYYPGLHTIDEESAIDIICKDRNIQ